jgi:hypothetical protein
MSNPKRPLFPFMKIWTYPAMISGTLVGGMQMWSSDQWQQAKPLTVDPGQAAKLLPVGQSSE